MIRPTPPNAGQPTDASGCSTRAPGSARVAICITTFRRPDGLKRLLASLDGLIFVRSPRPDIMVFVIDNDPDRPLHTTHQDLSTWTRLPLDYRVEANRGLAHARNAALAAVPDGFDAIAFIDDDEWAEPQWLDALLAVRASSGATVVQGPVRPQFSAEPEPWMRAVGFYEVGPFADAADLNWGASGNCLLDKSRLDAADVRFDVAYNVSGGEDTDLFDRLLRAGHRIVAAADAVAYETVPADRMNVAWAMRRSFRLGHTLGRVSLSHPGIAAKMQRLIKTFGRLGYGVLQMLVTPFARSTGIKGLINVAWACGTLAAYARRDVTQYHAPKV
jgi:succinoglycan biosynthesis protein ExoM